MRGGMKKVNKNIFFICCPCCLLANVNRTIETVTIYIMRLCTKICYFATNFILAVKIPFKKYKGVYFIK